MHLLEKYSLNCGMSPKKIGEPFIYTKYYPLDNDKYITIHNSSGMESKNYDYYQDVLDFLLPALKKNKITVIQIGGEQDTPLDGCLHLNGKTNIHQTAYILKNSRLHIGNDSFAIHICSAFGTPAIGLYSITLPEIAGPFWKNGPQWSLMADLEGKKPSYASKEPHKMVNRIAPEQIIKIATEHLNLNIGSECSPDLKTLYIGDKYPSPRIEAIPDHGIKKEYMEGQIIHIRADYLSEITESNVKFIAFNLNQRKCTVTTALPIPHLLALKKFRRNLIQIIYNIDWLGTDGSDGTGDLGFVLEMQKLGLPYQIALHASKKEAETDKFKEILNNIKLKYLDYSRVNVILESSIENLGKAKEEFENDPSSFYIRSSKAILSKGKIFITKQHLEENKPSTVREEKLETLSSPLNIAKELDRVFIFSKK
jgi:hypothetical protein